MVNYIRNNIINSKWLPKDRFKRSLLLLFFFYLFFERIVYNSVIGISLLYFIVLSVAVFIMSNRGQKHQLNELLSLLFILISTLAGFSAFLNLISVMWELKIM